MTLTRMDRERRNELRCILVHGHRLLLRRVVRVLRTLDLCELDGVLEIKAVTRKFGKWDERRGRRVG